MRSNPLLHWVLFAVAWGALAYPITRVVGSNLRPIRQVSTDSAARVTTWVTVRFSAPAVRFSLRQNDRLLLQLEDVQTLEHESTLPIAMDAHGTDLEVAVDLGEARAAIEITLEPDGRSARSRTLWVEGKTERTASFTWGPHDDMP